MDGFKRLVKYLSPCGWALFVATDLATVVVVVVFSIQYMNATALSFRIGFVGIITCFLCFRVVYLDRLYFMRGMERRNQLDQNGQESSTIIAQEVSQVRLQAIGEIAALVAHDLSGPLHVIQFCASELLDNLTSSRLKDYLTRIYRNNDRAIQLIISLRARLINPLASTSFVSFIEAHQHVLKLLKLQMRALDFNSICFSIDPSLESLRLKVSQIDIIHILDNIYRNAVDNLISNVIDKPEIRIEKLSINSDWVEISICDNGTGMSQEKFDEVTVFQIPQVSVNRAKAGLGLRLTKRLVELNGGQLSLVKSTKSPGTHLLLTLKAESPLTPVLRLSASESEEICERR